jgi:hypothetical protein
MARDLQMSNRHLYKMLWSQPYATYMQRPYLRSQQEQLEKLIEVVLDQGKFDETKEVLERIMKL